MSGVKLTGYRASITGSGKYMKVYFGEFPMSEILRPPEGWAFLKLTLWRKGCPDECWRIVYQRQALGGSNATSE